MRLVSTKLTNLEFVGENFCQVWSFMRLFNFLELGMSHLCDKEQNSLDLR